MKRALLSSLFAAGLLFSAPALATDAPPPPPSPPGAGADGDEDPGEAFMANFSDISQKIGLNADQQTKIKELFYNAGRQSIDLRANVQKSELDLRHAMSAENFDEKAVMKALDAQIAADAAFKRSRVQQLIELHKIVTADQWKQLEQMRSERRQGRRDDDDGERGAGRHQ